MNWPWNKKEEDPNLEDRLDNIEDFIYRTDQQNQDAGDVGWRLSCLDRAIGTLVSSDSMIKVESTTIIKYADVYYTFIIKNVSPGDNQ